MHYWIQKIYHVYYTTPWNFIILRKFSHMTLTSPNEKWMRFADIVRRFCHFLLWRGEFCFDVVGNFGPKKMTPNCNALAKSIMSYLWVSYLTFVFSWQCKTMLFTKNNNIQWRHRNVRIGLRDINKKGVEIARWASKQVSRDSFVNLIIKYVLTVRIECTHSTKQAMSK